MSSQNNNRFLKEFYTPLKDKNILNNKYEISNDKPNALIIGDSISIGYSQIVRENLIDDINVLRVDVNCGDTKLGIDKIDDWLGDFYWDIIHFNWGLHDLCYRHPDSKLPGSRDKKNGTLSVSLSEYKINLEKLVCKLELKSKNLIFATTTIVPEGEEGRFAGDEVKYNKVAIQIMQKHNIKINDLYALTKKFPQEYFIGLGNVHYTCEGSKELAKAVSLAIKNITRV